jgi:hypothetical protein
MDSIPHCCAKNVFPVAVLQQGLAMISDRQREPSKHYVGFIHEVQRRLFPCDRLEAALEEITRHPQCPSSKASRFGRTMSDRKRNAIRLQVSIPALQKCDATKQGILQSLVLALKRNTKVGTALQRVMHTKYGSFMIAKASPVLPHPAAKVRSLPMTAAQSDPWAHESPSGSDHQGGRRRVPPDRHERQQIQAAVDSRGTQAAPTISLSNSQSAQSQGQRYVYGDL